MPPEEKNPPPKSTSKSDLDKDIIKKIFSQNKRKNLRSDFLIDASQHRKEHSFLKPSNSEKRNFSEPETNFPPAPSLKGKRLKKRLKNKFPIGIDIGSHSIKIVQLAQVDHQLKVLKMIKEELPIEIMEDPENYHEEFLKFLCSTLKKNNIKGEVYVAIGNDKVDIQTISLQQMPFKEIPGAIRSEVMLKSKKNIDDLSFDYVLLNENEMKKNNSIEALVSTAVKKDILEYIDTLESCGLKVLSIEPNIFSLLASLMYNEKIKSTDVALILDFGGRVSNLSIVRNEKIQYTRSININGYAIISAVKKYYDVSVAEAEHFIKDLSRSLNVFLKNMDGNPQGKSANMVNQELVDKTFMMRNAVLIPFDKLISDIEHTFKYYSYRLTKSEITGYDKIILSGGLANFSLLTSFIEEKLNVPVEIDTPLSILEVDKRAVINPEYLGESALRFSVAIGLALRAIE